MADLYGVLRGDGRSERAIFVIDKQGVVRYVDVHDIDQQPDNEVLFNVLSEIEPELAAAYQAAEAKKAAAAQPAAEPKGDLIMYCTPWCPGCRRARVYFAENGISYVEIDITRDREAAARVRAWADGNETTPTFNIRGQVLVGYDERKLKELLGLPV